MAVASKTWTVGEVVTAGNMNTYVRDNLSDLQANKLNIATGNYTGDGTTSKAVTGIGFEPTAVFIWREEAAGGGLETLLITTNDFIDNDTTGLALYVQNGGVMETRDDAIISLDSDGFTVDDDGSDNHPNKNGQGYTYLTFGVG